MIFNGGFMDFFEEIEKEFECLMENGKKFIYCLKNNIVDFEKAKKIWRCK